MAIKIITMVGDNYGSALQAYALQRAVKKWNGEGGKHGIFAA